MNPYNRVTSYSSFNVVGITSKKFFWRSLHPSQELHRRLGVWPPVCHSMWGQPSLATRWDRWTQLTWGKPAMDQMHVSQTTKVTRESRWRFIPLSVYTSSVSSRWSQEAAHMITPGPEHRVLAAAVNPNTALGPKQSDKQERSKAKSCQRRWSKAKVTWGDAQGSVNVSEWQHFLCPDSWRSPVQKRYKRFRLSPVTFHSVASDYVESRSRKCSAWILIAWEPEMYSKQIFLSHLVILVVKRIRRRMRVAVVKHTAKSHL